MPDVFPVIRAMENVKKSGPALYNGNDLSSDHADGDLIKRRNLYFFISFGGPSTMRTPPTRHKFYVV